MSGGGSRRGTDAALRDFSRSVLTRISIQNQMQDAMTIWDSICHSQWFKSTSIVGEPLFHSRWVVSSHRF